MPEFDKNLLYYKLPPVIYAGLILLLSSLSSAAVPGILGVAWEDKIYHCLEYFIFGLLVARAFPSYHIKPRRRFKIAALIAFGWVYGAADETVQYFVPGRDSSPSDWAADALGFTLAVFVVIWWRAKPKYDVAERLQGQP